MSPIADNTCFLSPFDDIYPMKTRIESTAQLGSAIRDRRRAQRLTQEELARRAAVGRQWVNQSERGKAGAPLPLVLAVLGVLGCHLTVEDEAQEEFASPHRNATENKPTKTFASAVETEPTPAATPHSESSGEGETPLKTNDSHCYTVADLLAAGFTPDPSRLFEKSYRPQLREMVAHVVSIEAPIFQDLLARRIARAHGLNRATNKVQKTVRKLIDTRFDRSAEGRRGIIWSENTDRQQFPPYRRASLSERDHADIPLVELASLARTSLAKTVQEVASFMRDKLGLTRLAPNTRKRFETAAQLALDRRHDRREFR